jgi:sigma-B regulation protein RsbQ
VAPAFQGEFRTILFDHVGAGGSDLSPYNPVRYADLAGYADDVVAIGQELGLSKAIFVGHSVSAMIGVLASIQTWYCDDHMNPPSHGASEVPPRRGT